MVDADYLRGKSYLRAHQLGEELLQLVQGSPTEGDLDRIMELLDQREQAILSAAGTGEPPEQLALQQRTLEAQFQCCLETGRLELAGSHETKRSIQGTRTLFGVAGRSQVLNVRK